MIKDLLNDSTGAKVVAILLGIGLDAIFRKSCRGDKCIVIKSPGREVIGGYYYKLEDDCYKYTPYAVACDDDDGKNKSTRPPI